MNTGKQMIALFIVIGACLGIAAFVLVLTSKQSTKCPTRENYPEMKLQVGTTNGAQCWGAGTCHLKSPPAGVVARFCTNRDCTGCDGTWDVGVDCDTNAVDQYEHTGRCIAAPAGGDTWDGGGNHYGDGYICWTKI